MYDIVFVQASEGDAVGRRRRGGRRGSRSALRLLASRSPGPRVHRPSCNQGGSYRRAERWWDGGWGVDRCCSFLSSGVFVRLLPRCEQQQNVETWKAFCLLVCFCFCVWLCFCFFFTLRRIGKTDVRCRSSCVCRSALLSMINSFNVDHS